MPRATLSERNEGGANLDLVVVNASAMPVAARLSLHRLRAARQLSSKPRHRIGSTAIIVTMATLPFDFWQLTPAERIDLAQQLWESIEPTDIDPTEAQVSELRSRRIELENKQAPGQPWPQVLAGILEQRF